MAQPLYTSFDTEGIPLTDHNGLNLSICERKRLQREKQKYGRDQDDYFKQWIILTCTPEYTSFDTEGIPLTDHNGLNLSICERKRLQKSSR